MVRRQVLGSVVMTKYNQRTYTIHDVAWNITPTSTFSFHGSEITYHDYYQQVITLTWYFIYFFKIYGRVCLLYHDGCFKCYDHH